MQFAVKRVHFFGRDARWGPPAEINGGHLDAALFQPAAHRPHLVVQTFKK